MSEPWWPPVFSSNIRNMLGRRQYKATYSGPYGLVIVERLTHDNYSVEFLPAGQAPKTAYNVTRLELRALLNHIHTMGNLDEW